MNFNDHSRLEGRHAFLGASKHHWINYDEEKLFTSFLKHQAIQKGVELHDLAMRLIRLGVKLPRNNKTLNMYVNDAIGFQMETEVFLYYSENCFGQADAVIFRDGMLRVHDLKTGDSPTSMNQLMVYASLFCLEYNVRPSDIDIELRKYQSDDKEIHHPEPNDIFFIMDKIILFDKKIEQIKIGG